MSKQLSKNLKSTCKCSTPSGKSVGVVKSAIYILHSLSINWFINDLPIIPPPPVIKTFLSLNII